MQSHVRRCRRPISPSAVRRGTLWFQGHWGFQFAMERRGARPPDRESSQFHLGDVVVVPMNNTNTWPLPADVPVRFDRFEIPLGVGATTISLRRGAGLYSSFWGPLPYRLDPPLPERYVIVWIE
jgi:hypothetical protein